METDALWKRIEVIPYVADSIMANARVQREIAHTIPPTTSWLVIGYWFTKSSKGIDMTSAELIMMGNANYPKI